MKEIDNSTQKLAPKEHNYAGFWIRLGAFVVDAIVLSPVLLIHQISLIIQFNNPSFVNKTVTLSCWIIFCLYFALLESSKMQGTLGKWVLGLKVIYQSASRVSELRATGRVFIKVLFILSLYIFLYIEAYIGAICIGLYIFGLMIGWKKRKQVLHDIVVQSFVVQEEKSNITTALKIVWEFILNKIINEESSIGRNLKLLRVFILSKTIDNIRLISLQFYT